MDFLLYLFLLVQPPLSISGPITPGPVVNPDGSPAFPTNYRSTAQIILTCFTIVFASTWVCIHHHVPGYKTTQFQRWGLRARFLLNAILFPDKFVKRAFEQWMGCRLLYSDMERQITELGIAMDTPSGEPLLWTHVHAHFIQMGGIVFEETVDPDAQGSSIIKSETAVFSLPPREGAGRRRFLRTLENGTTTTSGAS
ncbi:hypothetical protein NMY22_g16926 [Coprinellus aureogranulatus]|nr:hypothetical protein NMY22_g16926 [Coprinellus aureogranulatus]